MINWTIAKLDLHDPNDNCQMFAILPDDDTNGYNIGEMADVVSLLSALRAFVEGGGQADETIDELDERLGWHWLSSSQAAREFDIPKSTMRLWMAQSAHSEKRGREWYAPSAIVRGWVARSRRE